MHHTKEIWEKEKASTLSETNDSQERLRHLSYELHNILSELKVKLVVDLGIGDGELAKDILSLSPTIQIVGIDFSRLLLKKAKSKLQALDMEARLIECNFLENLPIRGHFDAFLLARTLHHMDQATIKGLLSRLREYCDPNSKIVIIERWAFIPRNKLQADLRKVRLAISDAMFPGIGEFHHSFQDYVAMAKEAKYSVERLVWHRRLISIENYAQKVNKWLCGI